MGSPGILLEFTKKPMPLQKDDKGVWSLTIGPLPPGFYTPTAMPSMAGLRMPDPSNPDLELRRWGPTSSFMVHGGEASISSKNGACRTGTVHVEFYDSRNLDMGRMVYVLHAPRL